MTAPARIYEGGYRRYDGPRLGPNHAVRSLITTTLQRIFGLHRPARAKVLPALAVLIAYLPPAVFVGLAALLPDRLAEEAMPSFGGIYGFISAAIILFVLFVAPEALCPDRRSGVLSLYLSAPLTRDRYLAAKAAAIAIALLFVTLGPPLLLLVGLVLQNAGPDGVGEVLLTLGRILLAGVALSAVFTGLSVAVASLTDRRAVAAAGTFIFINAVDVALAVLTFSVGLPEGLLATSVARAPILLAMQIHGDLTGVDVTVAGTAAGCVAWTAIGFAVAFTRYRKLQVTR